MIKIGLAATNDAAGLDNKNVSAFIELAQKNDCEVIKGESEFFEPEEAKRVANGLKDCDLIVVTVKGFKAKGKRLTTNAVESIKELEPLRVPEADKAEAAASETETAPADDQHSNEAEQEAQDLFNQAD